MDSNGAFNGRLPTLARLGMTGPDVAVLGCLVCLLCVLFPVGLFPTWTPRFAILIAVGVPGLLTLCWSALSDMVSRAALLWLVIVWFSSAVSAAPRSLTIGFAGRDLSALSISACIGLWALARTASPRARHLVMPVLVVGATVNAVIAHLQVAFHPASGEFALQGGRPAAFLVNPVYLGAVCAGGAVVASMNVLSTRAWYLASGFCASACVLSGSRVAWAALLVVAFLGWARTRTPALRTGLISIVVGMLFGVVFDAVLAGGTNSVDRVASSGGGRLDVWRYGLSAFGDRPLLGFGFGAFRPAVQGRFSLDFVAAHASSETTQPWFDSHNVVIGVLVATGLVGLVALCTCLAFAIRQVSGPLAWGALAISLTWMLQPVSLNTLPVTCLMLGAATAPVTFPSAGVVARRLTIGVACASILFAIVLVTADVRLRRAADALDFNATRSAASWFGDDPVVADVVAEVARLANDDHANTDSLRWRAAAVEREPDRPYWWNQLASEQLETGDVAGARTSVERSLELEPAGFTANLIALDVALAEQDRARVTEQLDVLCVFDERACSTTPDDLLDPSDRPLSSDSAPPGPVSSLPEG